MEESSQRKRLSPSAVIGIAYDKTGKDEEEVDGKIAVIDKVDNGLVARKLESLEYVIPYYEERRYASQTVEKGVMWLRIFCFGILFFHRCKGKAFEAEYKGNGRVC